MWVIDDKSGCLLANTGDFAYMGEPLIIATASSILEDLFLNIPLMVVKNCRWHNVLKETKLHIFCLFLLQIQFLSVFCWPTAQRYSGAHINDRELKTCENNIWIFCNVFFFQIFCAKDCVNYPLHTVELSKTR